MFAPPRGNPYFSARCKLRKNSDARKRSDSVCDLNCPHLEYVEGEYRCAIGKMERKPMKIRETDWS